MDNGKQIIATEQVERDNFADFLKYILISLVVLGHFINLYQNRAVLGGLYSWIYTFHMPLFVFISGYFSKQLNYRRKSIDTILFPFVLFQLLNVLYAVVVPIEPLKDNIFYPYHQNWYLIALFWWRCFVPYRQFFKKWLIVVFSFILSLLVGCFPEWGDFLGLYKTAYFFPFFVLGVYCEDLAKLLSRLMRYRWILIFVFMASIIVVFLFSTDSFLHHKMLYAFKADLGYDGEWQNLFLRACALVVSIIMCGAVLVVVRLLYNRLKYSNLYCLMEGGGTMLAFLGHEFVMIPLIHFYGKFGMIGYVLCICTSFIVTFILTRKALVNFFSPLLDMSVLCRKLRIKIYNEKD